MRQNIFLAAIALSGLAISAPGAARVHEETEDSFVTRQGVIVPASPEEDEAQPPVSGR